MFQVRTAHELQIQVRSIIKVVSALGVLMHEYVDELVESLCNRRVGLIDWDPFCQTTRVSARARTPLGRLCYASRLPRTVYGYHDLETRECGHKHGMRWLKSEWWEAAGSEPVQASKHKELQPEVWKLIDC
jgi:hypothetical protein